MDGFIQFLVAPLLGGDPHSSVGNGKTCLPNESPGTRYSGISGLGFMVDMLSCLTH